MLTSAKTRTILRTAMLLPLAYAACLAAVPAQSPAPIERTQYAIVVANNSSNDKALEPLRYADDDGARYFELFSPQSDDAVLLTVLDEETQALHPGLASRSLPPT